MRRWYFIENGERSGPVVDDQFKSLFVSGRLNAETYVWTKGMENWIKAGLVDNFLPRDIVPPAPPISDSMANSRSPEPDVSGPQVRPWVRYWARQLDYAFWGIAFGIPLAFIYEPILNLPTIVLGFIFLVPFVLTEATLLSTWGTTPGKALLKIRVRRLNGDKPSFGQAFGRTADVIFRGVGLWIPIVAFFTHITAYYKLTRNGITSWDKAGGFAVEHRSVGYVRAFLVAIGLFGIFVILVLLGMQEQYVD